MLNEFLLLKNANGPNLTWPLDILDPECRIIPTFGVGISLYMGRASQTLRPTQAVPHTNAYADVHII